MHYSVAFDVASAGYRYWGTLAFCLLFVSVGLLLVVTRNRPGRWRKLPPAAWKAFACLWLGFSVLATVLVLVSTYGSYLSLRKAEKSGHVSVVQGRVVDFEPTPYSGHGFERFCVSGHCFEYAGDDDTAGFNDTRIDGGPIREGLPVRVTYVGNSIVKLEVAQ